MRNPLHKRLPRELFGEIGRYLVIFLFMTLTIGFVSGFLVAANSLMAAYNESFEKYNIEDGHFELTNKPKNTLLEKLEQEGVDIYELYFKDVDADINGDGEKDALIRIYRPRNEVDGICLMEGAFPVTASEVAVDRMFADNNELTVGDRIRIGEEELTITGLVAFSDYSCLFEDNNDLMFDSLRFSVAVLTDDAYHVFPESKEHYNYAWIYHEKPANDKEANQKAEDFIEVLAKEAYRVGNGVETVVPEYMNNAIIFTGNDMGSDRSMMLALLYILIVIMAFIFAVTIKHTITKESAVIGTLRASGYTKGEIFRHYMAVPMLVTLIAAVVGNVLGYTLFKDVAAAMYYGSYSLTTYVTIWNADAFVKTTLVPFVLMFIVNAVVLLQMLKLSPLRFIRRDLAKKKRKKAVKLPKLRFFTRFQIRVVLQNMPNYLVLLFGIMFVSLLLLFGMVLGPLLNGYQEIIIENMPARYQYVLKTQIETENEQAEKYCMTALDYEQGEWTESISIYGIEENSAYIPLEFPKEGVIISEGYTEKYGVKVGDEITLKESYGDKVYTFVVAGTVYYPSALAVFMERNAFNELFEMEADSSITFLSDPATLLKKLTSQEETDYFTGYFSNEILEDVGEQYTASIITVDDMTKLSRQLNQSMGSIFGMIKYFALIMAAMLIYLLTKLILEKNTGAISMVKILGYENGEIAGLYLMSTTWVVLLSTFLGLAVSSLILLEIYKVFMMSYSGWISLSVNMALYPVMMVMMMAAYGAVAVMQFRKIKKIPMDEALKNVE